MPRFPRLFGRTHVDAVPGDHSTDVGPLGFRIDPRDLLTPVSSAPNAPEVAVAPPRVEVPPPLTVEAGATGFPPANHDAPPAAPSPEDRGAPALSASVSDRRAGTLLIGGVEEDIVPVIPDTAVEFQASDSLFDEDAAMQAAVDALMAACRAMIAQVKVLRQLPDGTQIVSGLIALVSDLDMRYANDWGVVRHNGLEMVLNDVRASIPEGDIFILESLEDGRGGLTADVFLRDLRTIAAIDRPRMVSHYTAFLVLVLQCVLRQYLVPLQHEPARLRDVSKRLEYLIDGVRDTLLARINGMPWSGS